MSTTQRNNIWTVIASSGLSQRLPVSIELSVIF